MLASRFALRKCRGYRFSSSDSGELQHRAPHVPISTSFGSIQIQPSPYTKRTKSSNDTVEDISKPSASYQEGDQSRARKQLRERMDRGVSPGVEQGGPDMERRSRPDGQRRAWRRTQMVQRQTGPNEDLMQTRRHPRPGREPWRQRRMVDEGQEYSHEDHDVEEWGENDDSITILQSGMEDVPLPQRAPSLLTPLTNLGIRVTDMPLTEARERVGGDYTRHFTSGELERVRAQSSLSLGVLDRARLALSLNRTIGLEEKRVGVDMVKKTMGKMAVAQ